MIFASSASLAQDDDLGSLNQRIYKLFAEGKYQEAIPLAEKAVGIAMRVRGPEDPETATSLNNLGELYFNVYQYTKALAALQEALRIRQKVLGKEHPYTAFSLNNLAELYQAMSLGNLGSLYQAMGQYAKAEPLYQEALRIYEKVLGSEDPNTATGLDNLGELYSRMGQYPKAEPLLHEALLKIHSPYILHLATHGFFAKEDPTSAKTEPEALMTDRQSVIKSKFFKNPMHRSGLALAGAQTTVEAWKRDEVPPVENDGILTAEDVSTLDLQGTWLVTLSACEGRPSYDTSEIDDREE